tara:strand:+ start:680 stop:1288 length:609 start_codon:yes stop_codon:yes gene_type:complete
MSNFSEILSDVRNGNPILIVDDHDRENEGDIVIAAEKATIDNIAFCMRYARGLMCMPCSGEILDSLELPMMVENSTDRNQTPFTVSVDAAEDTSTGMSAADRLATISVFLDPERKPSDLNRPGHLFPLRPQDDLLKERKGHTEASIEVVKAAGFQQTCIIVEIINDDGTMAKGNDLIKFCKKHNIAMISVQEIYDSIYKQSV